MGGKIEALSRGDATRLRCPSAGGSLGKRAIALFASIALLIPTLSSTATAQLMDGRVLVDANASVATIAGDIAVEVGKEVIDILVEIGVDAGTVPAFIPPSITIVDPASRLAAYFYEAALQYQAGNTDVAATTARIGLVEVVPAAAGIAVGTLVALELPATVIAVGIGAAASGVTLPAAAILVAAVIIVAGVGAAVTMGTEKLAEVAIEAVEEQGVPLRRP